MLLPASWYDLPAAVVPGTVAVAVAAAGSVAVLRISQRVRAADLPDAYPRLLFGSSVEVVLGVLAFVGLVTDLFVVDPRGGDTAFVTVLLGPVRVRRGDRRVGPPDSASRRGVRRDTAALLPFVRTEPVLVAAVGGHLVAAVGAVSLAAWLSVTERDDTSEQGDY